MPGLQHLMSLLDRKIYVCIALGAYHGQSLLYRDSLTVKLRLRWSGLGPREERKG